MADLTKFNDTLALVSDQAERLIHRESTDFFGRMNQTLMEAEGLSEDGDTIPPHAAEDYREAMIALAALALAQAVMSLDGIEEPPHG